MFEEHFNDGKVEAFYLMYFLNQVRKITANRMYEVLVTYDDIAPEENLEELMTVLSETIW